MHTVDYQDLEETPEFTASAKAVCAARLVSLVLENMLTVLSPSHDEFQQS